MPRACTVQVCAGVQEESRGDAAVTGRREQRARQRPRWLAAPGAALSTHPTPSPGAEKSLLLSK